MKISNFNPNIPESNNFGSQKDSKKSSIFAEFSDTDGIIDSSDVKYSKDGVISKEIKQFFDQYSASVTKWTNELKNQFFEILNEFNSGMQNKNNDDFEEIADLILYPHHVIYDKEGRVAEKLCYDVNGDSVTVKYNDAGKVAETKDASGNTTTFTYKDDLLVKRADEKGWEREYTYDAFNHVISETTTVNGSISQTRNEYDTQNRLVKTSFSSSYNNEELTEDVILVYEYDENNQKKSRAFLPDGREFENFQDAGFYLQVLQFSAISGSKQPEAALKQFKVK